MYGDKNFRRLSRVKPSAQSLWLYLLTGPHTQTFPGLFRIGEASLAESLGWRLAATKRCLLEIERVKSNRPMLVVDRTHTLMFAPSAFRHNPPESPNVCKAWARSIAEFPECNFVCSAVEAAASFLGEFGEPHLRSFIAGLRETGVEAFVEAALKPSGKLSVKPSTKPSAKPSRSLPGRIPPTLPRISNSNSNSNREKEKTSKKKEAGEGTIPSQEEALAQAEIIIGEYVKAIGKSDGKASALLTLPKRLRGKKIQGDTQKHPPHSFATLLAWMRHAIADFEARKVRDGERTARTYTPNLNTLFGQAFKISEYSSGPKVTLQEAESQVAERGSRESAGRARRIGQALMEKREAITYKVVRLGEPVSVSWLMNEFTLDEDAATAAATFPWLQHADDSERAFKSALWKHLTEHTGGAKEKKT